MICGSFTGCFTRSAISCAIKAPFINPAGCGGNSGVIGGCGCVCQMLSGIGPMIISSATRCWSALYSRTRQTPVKPSPEYAVLFHRIIVPGRRFHLRRAVDPINRYSVAQWHSAYSSGERSVATGLSISRISVVRMCLATRSSAGSACSGKTGVSGRLMPAGMGRKLKSSSSGCDLVRQY